ncbi:MAG: DsbA family protein [Gammaproteobacteria bacterium]
MPVVRCNMIRAVWYFDLISPFAYLHFKRLHELSASLEIERVPVLFAGLLKHWEHKGPAEIPSKRVYTYRYVTWLAKHLGILFKIPPSHPFNSLHALRLLIAAGHLRKRPSVLRNTLRRYNAGRKPRRESRGFAPTTCALRGVARLSSGDGHC